jgi:hypothetical protein
MDGMERSMKEMCKGTDGIVLLCRIPNVPD